jgi:hypothetical protein
MISISDQYSSLSLEQSLWIARREVAELVGDLEPTLTDHQRSLLHQLRLAAESLGAVRATLALQAR